MWSYTFTDYHHFTSGSNAVTPRPNWPVESEENVSISKTPPLDETDYNAMNFPQWKQLGREFLIKSNINNWLSCQPGVGSLVDWKGGSIKCRIVNHVTDTCDTLSAPSMLSMFSHGPIISTPLNSPGHYYFFDGSADQYYPTHDPCGNNKDNSLKSVTNPHGNIFIR